MMPSLVQNQAPLAPCTIKVAHEPRLIIHLHHPVDQRVVITHEKLLGRPLLSEAQEFLI
jgi:hypothetical protein